MTCIFPDSRMTIESIVKVSSDVTVAVQVSFKNGGMLHLISTKPTMIYTISI